MTTLDENYPQGDPESKDCRGCGLTKLEHNGARICPECDGPACVQKEIPPAVSQFETKDSGERARFDSGMQRDTKAGKPHFDLLIPEGVPYAEQFLTRIAALMGRGAEKYEDRNWEQADSEAELARMKSSAFRHFMQWFCGDRDEDHAAATVFNLLAAETTEAKLAPSEEPLRAIEGHGITVRPLRLEAL